MAHTCKNCGAVADDPGHLCDPCGDAAKCSFCGDPKVEHKHMCKDKLAAGSNAQPTAWYHKHWRPLDAEKYPGDMGTDSKLRQRCFADNAPMLCLPCEKAGVKHQRSFRPSTNFGNHLLHACAAFKSSPDYDCVDVARALDKVVSKKVLPASALIGTVEGLPCYAAILQLLS